MTYNKENGTLETNSETFYGPIMQLRNEAETKIELDRQAACDKQHKRVKEALEL